MLRTRASVLLAVTSLLLCSLSVKADVVQPAAPAGSVPMLSDFGPESLAFNSGSKNNAGSWPALFGIGFYAGVLTVGKIDLQSGDFTPIAPIPPELAGNSNYSSLGFNALTNEVEIFGDGHIVQGVSIITGAVTTYTAPDLYNATTGFVDELTGASVAYDDLGPRLDALSLSPLEFNSASWTFEQDQWGGFGQLAIAQDSARHTLYMITVGAVGDPPPAFLIAIDEITGSLTSHQLASTGDRAPIGLAVDEGTGYLYSFLADHQSNVWLAKISPMGEITTIPTQASPNGDFGPPAAYAPDAETFIYAINLSTYDRTVYWFDTSPNRSWYVKGNMQAGEQIGSWLAQAATITAQLGLLPIGSSVTVVLDFGAPNQWPGINGKPVYGATLWQAGKGFRTSDAQITEYVDAYMSAWNAIRNPVLAPRLTLVVGTNTSGNHVTAAGAKNWAKMIRTLRRDANGYGGINVLGGIDAEYDFDPTGSKFLLWTKAYQSVLGKGYADFGDANNCENPVAGVCIPNTAWTLDNLALNYGAKAIPEIYNQNGRQATAWKNVSKWNKTHHGSFVNFAAPMTQLAACQQFESSPKQSLRCKKGIWNTPRSAGYQLQAALADIGQSISIGGPATDIRWRVQPSPPVGQAEIARRTRLPLESVDISDETDWVTQYDRRLQLLNTFSATVPGLGGFLAGAGYRPETPKQGIVVVHDPRRYPEWTEVPSPTATGPLMVVARENDVLVLRSQRGAYQSWSEYGLGSKVSTPGGIVYEFNMRTQKFVEPRLQ